MVSPPRVPPNNGKQTVLKIAFLATCSKLNENTWFGIFSTPNNCRNHVNINIATLKHLKTQRFLIFLTPKTSTPCVFHYFQFVTGAQSEVLTCGHITIYGHIWSYMAIYGHIWPYMANIWPIYGHIWPYMANIWPYMAIYGQYTTIYGHI